MIHKSKTVATPDTYVGAVRNPTAAPSLVTRSPGRGGERETVGQEVVMMYVRETNSPTIQSRGLADSETRYA